MKVAKKSPHDRRTITLPASTYALIDTLREGTARSAFVEALVEKERARRQRTDFLNRVRQEYTPAVRKETLRVNDEFPIHDA